MLLYKEIQKKLSLQSKSKYITTLWQQRQHKKATKVYFHCSPLRKRHTEINKIKSHSEERLKVLERILMLKQRKGETILILFCMNSFWKVFFLITFISPFKSFYNNKKTHLKATVRTQLHKSSIKIAIIKTHIHTHTHTHTHTQRHTQNNNNNNNEKARQTSLPKE